MGYTTEFEGQFDLDKPLTDEQKLYITSFCGTRRMKRNSDKAEKLNDPIRKAVGLPIGKDAEFFVGGLGTAGQDRDESIVQYNDPPASQPGLWCQWVPNEDGTAIEWDGSEKFYEYIEWIRYMINSFFKPWGIKLNGKVRWRGENFDDIGAIVIKNNKVSIKTIEV